MASRPAPIPSGFFEEQAAVRALVAEGIRPKGR
jgi:hypothetical protein